MSGSSSIWSEGGVQIRCEVKVTKPPTPTSYYLARYSYPEMVLRGTLLGGTDLRYVDVAFSRDGGRVAAFGNRTDHLATVWNVKKKSINDEGLTGEKV